MKKTSCFIIVFAALLATAIGSAKAGEVSNVQAIRLEPGQATITFQVTKNGPPPAGYTVENVCLGYNQTQNVVMFEGGSGSPYTGIAVFNGVPNGISCTATVFKGSSKVQGQVVYTSQ